MKALILVDIQNDFCPGGNLAVPNGDEVVAPANKLISYARRSGWTVIASKDWHPADHGSFASANGAEVMSMGKLDGLDQVMWPDHCVQGTEGAEFHKDLQVGRDTIVVEKGRNVLVDSYSAFYDNGKREATTLPSIVKIHKIDEVYVCGLALDYCVGFTCLDAVGERLKVNLVEDACRGVGFPEGSIEDMLARLTNSGVNITTTNEIIGNG